MDARLRLISTMISPCSKVADVGTDHGKLICELIKSEKCRYGTATDIKPKPLENAKCEIARQGLSDRIETRLTDGLCGVERQDAVVIAGMGGNLIAEIIERWEFAKADGVTFYLQPMTKAEKLREWLYINGYCILRECCCTAGGRPYSVIEAVYINRFIDYKPVDLYLGKIDSSHGGDARRYCEHLRNRLKKTLLGMQRGERQEQQFYNSLLQQIEGRLNE